MEQKLDIFTMNLAVFQPIHDLESPESIDWWKRLDSNQRINLKDMFDLVCGLSWEELSYMFNVKQRIHILYTKLKKEGFLVDEIIEDK